MANFLSPILRPIGLDPSQGYDTAAAGAQQAGQQANALSQLQWQRQMQGLQGALGYVGNLQSLYNSIYGPGGGKVAAGGGNVTQMSPGQMAALSGPPPGAQAPAGGQGGSLGSSVKGLAGLGGRVAAAGMTGGLSETKPGRYIEGKVSDAWDKTIGKLF